MKNPNQRLIDAERKWYDATQLPESNPSHPGDWSTCQRLDGSTEVRFRHIYLAVYFDDVLTLRRSAGDGIVATVTHYKAEFSSGGPETDIASVGTPTPPVGYCCTDPSCGHCSGVGVIYAD